jgi:DNA-binding response OmpR family regulator
VSAVILVVEDEQKIARFLELELTHEGYEVLIANDGSDALDLALCRSIDLVLLDIMLPSLNGIEVLRRLRREKDTPVILLTARDELNAKVTGPDLGADDYITKPFRIEELLARIRAALRRSSQSNENILRMSDLILDTARHTVERGGVRVSLTKREFDLLEFLMRNQGIVLSRDQLIERVWGFEFEGDSNVVDVYIRYLRTKIDDSSPNKLIRTVRGVGYSMREGEA